MQISKLIRRIFTIGGFNGLDRIADIEAYDIIEDSWKLLALQLPCGITNAAAVSVSPSKVLLFGGG